MGRVSDIRVQKNVQSDVSESRRQQGNWHFI